MKLPRLLFIIAALASSALAQTAGVTKSLASASLNEITGDLTFPSARSLTLNGTLAGTPTGGTLNLSAVTLTPPSNIVTLTGAQTLTNKTLTSPTLTTPNIGAATGTSVNLSGAGTFGGDVTLSKAGPKFFLTDTSDTSWSVRSSAGYYLFKNETANIDIARFIGSTLATAKLEILATTDSINKDSGAIVTEGGLGVEKSATIGGNLTVSGGTITGGSAVTGLAASGSAGHRVDVFAGAANQASNVTFYNSGSAGAGNASYGRVGMLSNTNFRDFIIDTGANGTGVRGNIALNPGASGTVSTDGNLTVSGGTITGGLSGMSLAAGGTNQNITLTPSGTGNVLLGSLFGFDFTNTRLGVGTQSPTASFHVVSGSKYLRATISGTPQQIISDGTRIVYYGINGDNLPCLTAQSNDHLVFGTNNSEKVRLFANGNFGIGTGGTDGGQKLQVSGTAFANRYDVLFNDNPTGTSPRIFASASSGSTVDVLVAGGGSRAGNIQYYNDGGGTSRFMFGTSVPSSTTEHVRFSMPTSGLGSSVVSIYGTTASTSTTTGALQVAGGVGVAGAVNAGGNVTAADVLLGGTSGPSTLSSLSSRAPRGGIAFDGTSGARISSTLTNQNLGTDSFSVSMTIEVPTANPSTSRGLWYLSSSNTTNNVANAAFAELKTAGELVVYITGAASSDVRTVTVSGFRAAYSGKRVLLTFVRDSSASTMTVYANGVALSGTGGTTGTPPAWSGSVTSTYLVIGNNASGGEVWDRAIYSASLYNLALSASDVVEIYESSGAVPFRYQFGSQTARYTSDFSVGTDSWTVTGGAGAALTGNVDSIGAENDWQRISMVSGTGQLGMYRGSPVNSAIGKRFRIKGRLRHDSASIVSVNIQENNNTPNGFYVSVAQNTTVDFDSVWNNTIGSNAPLIVIISNQGAGTGESLYIKNLQAIQLGAIVHLTLDDGVGYQLHDASTNKLDAVMTTTGVSHLIAKREGYVRGTLTWASASDTKSLLGQQAFPSGVVLTDIIRKATASTSGTGCAIGNSNAANRWQGSTAMTTAKTVATINNRLPAGSSANDLDVLVTPDSVSYTGSITLEIRYAVTEGTP